MRDLVALLRQEKKASEEKAKLEWKLEETKNQVVSFKEAERLKKEAGPQMPNLMMLDPMFRWNWNKSRTQINLEERCAFLICRGVTSIIRPPIRPANHTHTHSHATRTHPTKSSTQPNRRPHMQPTNNNKMSLHSACYTYSNVRREEESESLPSRSASL